MAPRLLSDIHYGRGKGEGARFVVTNDCCPIIKINKKINLENVFVKHYALSPLAYPLPNHMPDPKREWSVPTYIDKSH